MQHGVKGLILLYPGIHIGAYYQTYKNTYLIRSQKSGHANPNSDHSKASRDSLFLLPFFLFS